ncbi:sister chromatid cohesion protein DCC1, partial [Tremellales sp. Uapishka_1]
MPAATVLPTSNVVIRFPPPSTTPDIVEETYQLLELPPEILKQVESSTSAFPLTIKGRPSDDAVLCTNESTFLLRTVSISNSLLILRPPEVEKQRAELEIRDTCHEVLECVPISGNLERIRMVLKGSAWEGMGGGKRKRGEDEEGKKRRRYTKAQLESIILASDKEIEQGLRERNVIECEGRLLLLPSISLQPLLSLILALLTIHSITSLPPIISAPINPIIDALEEDHEISEELTRGVMSLYGEIIGQEWNCRINDIVREVGKGLVESLRGQARSSDMFIDDWKTEVGPDYSDLVDLKLLKVSISFIARPRHRVKTKGEYLLDPAPPSHFTSSSPILTPFPSSTLPLHPPTRFADLFLTRPRWRPEDMSPFLKGLTRDGDQKGRDKLVVKFVRVVKEKDGGIWWYPRRSA